MTTLPRVVRVVIDARMVGPIPHGFSRYVTRLAQGLALLRRETPLVYEPMFLVGSSFAESHEPAIGSFESVRVGAPFLNPLELIEIPIILKKLGASAYHSPTFSSLFYCPCPWLVTVHDLNHLTYGGTKEKLYYRYLLKSFARKARVLATVSEFSRRELAIWLSSDESSIDIIYNSMDPTYLQPLSSEQVDPILKRFELRSRDYFICLSNSKPHKNVAMLVEAYQAYRSLLKDQEPLPLVLSMGDFDGMPGVRAVEKLADMDARALVAGSRAVVFPSLYEGFGLPPVEAVSMGVPALASKIPPHEEGLAGLSANSGVYWLDPHDREAWTRALLDATVTQPNLPSVSERMKLISRFDPLRMGQNMDRLYRRVLDSVLNPKQ